ncbi:MAG: hypothetical protein RI935_770 [Candidatus Parcubacteria bacterium]|jgi:hypothetical protein
MTTNQQSPQRASHVVPFNKLAHIEFACACFSNVLGNSSSDDPAVAVAQIVQQLRLLPKDQHIGNVDAVSAIAGIQLDGSVLQAISMFDQQSSIRHCLITGYHGQKRVDEMFIQNKVADYFGSKRTDGLISQGKANHTGHQAAWITQHVKELGLESLIVIAPAFHLPRVYVTFLEALRRVLGDEGYLKFKLIPIAYGGNPEAPELLDVAAEAEHGESDDSHEYRTVNQVMAVPGECNRIGGYQQVKPDGSQGDCLTTPRLVEYVQKVFGLEVFPWLTFKTHE